MVTQKFRAVEYIVIRKIFKQEKYILQLFYGMGDQKEERTLDSSVLVSPKYSLFIGWIIYYFLHTVSALVLAFFI